MRLSTLALSLLHARPSHIVSELYLGLPQCAAPHAVIRLRTRRSLPAVRGLQRGKRQRVVLLDLPLVALGEEQG